MLLKCKALINGTTIQIFWFHTAFGVLDGNLKAHGCADSRRRHVDGLNGDLGTLMVSGRVKVVVAFGRPLPYVVGSISERVPHICCLLDCPKKPPTTVPATPNH